LDKTFIYTLKDPITDEIKYVGTEWFVKINVKPQVVINGNL
jgi:hypothetical protein